MSELRWHPLLREWVITATHRQARTFLPQADACPLCPTRPAGPPTEVPAADYEIVVFENRFPSLHRQPPPAAVAGSPLWPVAPAQGECEVILYTSRHDASLGDLPAQHIANLVRVWTDRTIALGDRPGISYVFIFENRGRAIGVTLEHPHGQIYAFPFIPPQIERELAACEAYQQEHGRCLLCDIRAAEQADGSRLVAENDGWYAFVPFFARWPYEVHIVSRRHCGSLADLIPAELQQLADLLRTVTKAYDALFDFAFPYSMVLHQRPSDGRPHDSYHLHLEFYPPHRTADRLKYPAGCERGTGTFITDTLPEEKAAELRAAAIRSSD